MKRVRQEVEREMEKEDQEALEKIAKGVPKFPYNGPVVRKKSDRKKLLGYECHECKDYYKQKLEEGCSKEDDRRPMCCALLLFEQTFHPQRAGHRLVKGPISSHHPSSKINQSQAQQHAVDAVADQPVMECYRERRQLFNPPTDRDEFRRCQS